VILSARRSIVVVGSGGGDFFDMGKRDRGAGGGSSVGWTSSGERWGAEELERGR
jgi:hypothetical protein